MRSSLLILLVAILGLLLWMMMEPPREELPVQTGLDGPELELAQAEFETDQEGEQAAEDAGFSRGATAVPPVEPRVGFIPVQVWGGEFPIPGAKAALLPFSKLPEVLVDHDLWPFVITEEMVLRFGEAVTADSSGVVHVGESEGPTYVAAMQGKASAMLTLLPQQWDQEVVKLQLATAPPLQIQVRYANGDPVPGVPVYLGSEDVGNNSMLLGEDRRRRTTNQGTTDFALAAPARRLLGASGKVDPEVAELAAALGYAASEFDTLLNNQLSVVVPVYAGERVVAPLPSPYDFLQPAEIILESAGALDIRIQSADGSLLQGGAEIRLAGQPRRRNGRQSRRGPVKPYAFNMPEGRAKLASIAVGKSYELEIRVQGIGGTMERTIIGPVSSGEVVHADFITDDVARVGAILVDANGDAIANGVVKLAFFSDRRREELDCNTDEDGRIEAFVPANLADQPIDSVEILDGYLNAPTGAGGRTRGLRSTRIELSGVLSSFEDLGTLTLK
ncbi:MAG: hypothetical protein GY747_04435 [Planctomycetes bacterium]|nr:hypothetical protein [Planctomycetota bacterium]MCP4771494.1 hypothetical protein [Planctomycetota bacterium]MCP4861155.1 hypothetical protein [Planctomycetota bacterium]